MRYSQIDNVYNKKIKSKDRQYNGQKKKLKRTNNDRQNNRQKLKLEMKLFKICL
jgi:hypothetical protein